MANFLTLDISEISERDRDALFNLLLKKIISSHSYSSLKGNSVVFGFEKDGKIYLAKESLDVEAKTIADEGMPAALPAVSLMGGAPPAHSAGEEEEKVFGDMIAQVVASEGQEEAEEAEKADLDKEDAKLLFLAKDSIDRDVERIAHQMPAALAEGFRAYVKSSTANITLDLLGLLAEHIEDGAALADWIRLLHYAGLDAQISKLLADPHVLEKIEDRHQRNSLVRVLTELGLSSASILKLSKPETPVGVDPKNPPPTPKLYLGKLPDFWRTAPIGFEGAGRLQLPGEVGVVKRLVPNDKGKKPDVLLVRELLANQCYRILGANFPKSFLYGNPGSLLLEKELVGGQSFRVSGDDNSLSSPFRGVSSRELAVLTVSAAVLKDEDFAGVANDFKVGHNLRVQGLQVIGIDPGEAFKLKKGNLPLEFLKDSTSEFPLASFIEWLNQVVFDDRNGFLKEGEACPESLTSLREQYQKGGKTVINQADLVEARGLYKKGIVAHSTKGSPLWRFLKALLEGKGSSAFLGNFFSAFQPYGDHRPGDINLALNEFFEDAVLFRGIKALTATVTPADWVSAISEVSARVEQADRYLSEVDLPLELLAESDREGYRAQVQKNSKDLAEIQVKLKTAAALPLEEEPPAPIPLSPVFSEGIYYPDQTGQIEEGMQDLALLGNGMTSVVSRNIKVPLEKLEFQGVFRQIYDAQKGFGRRSIFKSSYSPEMESLKGLFESPGQGALVSWQDVEDRIISIFADDIERGQNPYDWSKLSNRVLWLFLMEAHYQQEQKIQLARESKGTQPEAVISHALFEAGSRKAAVWNGVFSPGASRASGAASQIAKVAEVFPQIRRQYPRGFESFLKILSSDISTWKKEHVKWYHFGRRIFGIKGISKVLKQLNNKAATPTEILAQVDLILKDRLLNGKQEDTKNLYRRLENKLLDRVGGPEALMQREGGVAEEIAPAV